MHSGYAIESEMNGQIRKDYVRHPKSSEERMNDWYCTCTYNMKSSRAENFHKISRIMQLWMPVVVYTLQRFFIRSRRFTFQISLYAFIPKIISYPGFPSVPEWSSCHHTENGKASDKLLLSRG